MRVPAAVVALVGLWTGTGLAADALFRWEAVPGANGYRLYSGTQSRAYTEQQDLGLLSADTVASVVYFLVTGLQGGDRFFAVTAYNDAGESEYSNEKEIVFDGGIPPVAIAGGYQHGLVGDTIRIGDTTGGAAQYIWVQRRGPPVALTDATSNQPSFIPLQSGAFEFVLVAYDAQGIASTDDVGVTVVDAPVPVLSPKTVLLLVTILAGVAWRGLQDVHKVTRERARAGHF